MLRVVGALATLCLLSGCLGVALTGLRGVGAASAARVGMAATASRTAALSAATRGAAAGFGEAGTMRAGSMALARANVRGAPRSLSIATDTGKAIGRYEVSSSGNQVTLRAADNRVAGSSTRFGNTFEHYDPSNRNVGYSRVEGNEIKHWAYDRSGTTHYVGKDVVSSRNRVSHFDHVGNPIGEMRLPGAERISADEASVALGLMTATGEFERSGNATDRFKALVREEEHWCNPCSHYHDEGPDGECPPGPPRHTVCDEYHYLDQSCPVNAHRLEPPPSSINYEHRAPDAITPMPRRYERVPETIVPVVPTRPHYSEPPVVVRPRYSRRDYSERPRIVIRRPRNSYRPDNPHFVPRPRRDMRRLPNLRRCGHYHYPGEDCRARRWRPRR